MLIKILFIFLFCVLTAATVLLTYKYIGYRRVNDQKIENENGNNDYGLFSRKEQIISVSVLTLISFLAGIFCYDRASSLISFCKIIFIYCTSCGIALTDIKLRIIPNLYSMIMLVGGMLFHIVDILVLSGSDPEIMQHILIYNVAAAVVVIIVLCFLSFITHSGMGFGDVKYLGALCFTGGITLLLISLTVSLICSLIYGVINIIRKKKSRKDTIPFGPFIFIGVTTCIFTGLM